ncbi:MULTISPECIES: cholesterol oxidase substrate-binding domain-containing protein [Streptomyces]|uniref:cholesterol oxidase substrate-binding domain-containing protein n=1 Tax=Streptomyces TaxID=1883 RepID=UPI002FE06F35
MLSGRSRLGPCVEWSKGCACTDDAAWRDGGVLESAAPGSFGEEGWGRAAGVLERLDPHRVLGNAFWDRLFAQRAATCGPPCSARCARPSVRASA